MQHAVIVAHPGDHSLSLAIAHAYVEAAHDRGHEAILRDLYRLNFDPCLRDEEIPRPSGFRPGEDVVAEREIIGKADAFVLIYPFWFNAPPAMLKGYVERVFGMGFGYGPIEGGRNAQLLLGRKLVSISTSGAPMEWIRKEGTWAAVRNLFDGHLADVCGLTVVDHLHFGGVLPDTPPATVAGWLEQVKQLVSRTF